jgi:hypothetical protein
MESDAGGRLVVDTNARMITRRHQHATNYRLKVHGAEDVVAHEHPVAALHLFAGKGCHGASSRVI